MGGTLDSRIYKELQLPFKTSSEFPHLEIRLTSAEETAASAFLLSAAGCSNLVEQSAMDTSLRGLDRDVSAKDAYHVCAKQCERNSVLSFQAFRVERPPQQKPVTALVHQRSMKSIPHGSSRLRIFRENMTLPEAKTWIHCRPSKALRTQIKPNHVRTWMK